MPGSRWIKKAVKPENRGVFKAKAEAAGMSTAAFAKKEEHAPGKLGKQARLAEVGMKASKSNGERKRNWYGKD